MRQVLYYKRTLDAGSKRVVEAFREHPELRVTVLQFGNKLGEDFDLVRPFVVALDWSLAAAQRASLLSRIRKQSPGVWIVIALPDFLGETAYESVQLGEVLTIPESSGRTEWELLLRHLARMEELRERLAGVESHLEGIRGEYENYRRILAEKDANIRNLETRIDDIVITDPVTGLANERHFLHQVRVIMEECRRYKENVCLLHLALDNLPQIGEVYGEEGAAAIRRETATLLRQSVRNNDLTGVKDEGVVFLVLYKKIRPESVRVIAGRLKKVLDEHVFMHHGKQIRVTTSIGLASSINYVENTFETDTLLAWSKIAFDNALKKGGNELVAYS